MRCRVAILALVVAGAALAASGCGGARGGPVRVQQRAATDGAPHVLDVSGPVAGGELALRLTSARGARGWTLRCQARSEAAGAAEAKPLPEAVVEIKPANRALVDRRGGGAGYVLTVAFPERAAVPVATIEAYAGSEVAWKVTARCDGSETETSVR